VAHNSATCHPPPARQGITLPGTGFHQLAVRHTGDQSAPKPSLKLVSQRVKTSVTSASARDRSHAKNATRWWRRCAGNTRPRSQPCRERLRKAQARREAAGRLDRQKTANALSFGSTLLGAFTGRKSLSGTISKATTAARKAGRAHGRRRRCLTRQRHCRSVHSNSLIYRHNLKPSLLPLAEKVDPLTEALETVTIKPKKTDIIVQLVSLAWAPYWQDEQGNTSPAW